MRIQQALCHKEIRNIYTSFWWSVYTLLHVLRNTVNCCFQQNARVTKAALTKGILFNHLNYFIDSQNSKLQHQMEMNGQVHALDTLILGKQSLGSKASGDIIL